MLDSCRGMRAGLKKSTDFHGLPQIIIEYTSFGRLKSVLIGGIRGPPLIILKWNNYTSSGLPPGSSRIWQESVSARSGLPPAIQRACTYRFHRQYPWKRAVRS